MTRVVDGDTFEVAGGRTIRILGIDSCESGTTGGEAATSRAQSILPSSSVSLTREPGVDRDRYGRELRYVYSDGLDFGMQMVGYTDTGVYEGRNGASAVYVAQLRAADYGARDCGGSTEPTTEPRYASDDDNDRRPYVPAPASTYNDSDSGSSERRHTGNTGHPCLPGERDGDNDGYCGEGR